MQSYSTIIGVIELRRGGIGYRTTRARYGIGNSTVTLIMNCFKETGRDRFKFCVNVKN